MPYVLVDSDWQGEEGSPTAVEAVLGVSSVSWMFKCEIIAGVEAPIG